MVRAAIVDQKGGGILFQPFDLLIPQLLVENKKPTDQSSVRNEIGWRDQAVVQSLLYCVSATKFLATLGVYEWPIFGLATTGTIGTLIAVGMSKLTKKTYVVMYGAKTYNIADPGDTFQLCVALAKIRALGHKLGKNLSEYMLPNKDSEDVAAMYSGRGTPNEDIIAAYRDISKNVIDLKIDLFSKDAWLWTKTAQREKTQTSQSTSTAESSPETKGTSHGQGPGDKVSVPRSTSKLRSEMYDGPEASSSKQGPGQEDRQEAEADAETSQSSERKASASMGKLPVAVESATPATTTVEPKPHSQGWHAWGA